MRAHLLAGAQREGVDGGALAELERLIVEADHRRGVQNQDAEGAFVADPAQGTRRG